MRIRWPIIGYAQKTWPILGDPVNNRPDSNLSRVRKYGDTVADGLDTDGLLWTVFFKDTPVTDPPIPLELMQYE